MAAPVQEYLSRVIVLFERELGAFADLEVFARPTDDFGTMRGDMPFPDGAVLSLRFTVDTRSGEPQRVAYAYHYRTADVTTVFRYDNAPHHPELPTYPHHRHEGASEQAKAAWEPSHHELIREVKSLRGGADRRPNE